MTAERAETEDDVRRILAAGQVPVLADPRAACRAWLRPDVVVDAILAKKNLGTAITDAPLVIGVGPGFCAGKDCHAVIETMRGHTLGRVIRTGEPIPNTNIPGLIGGFTGERVLRAPDDGIFHQLADIGARVQAGDVVGEVNGKPMACTIAGVIRGMLADGTPVYKGMKSGDVDRAASFPTAIPPRTRPSPSAAACCRRSSNIRAFFRMSRVKMHGRYNIE